MGTPNVVPAVETPAEEATQGRSTIRFPYLDQDDAVGIAKAIYAVAGHSCERDALAAHLNVSAQGGGFNLRLITAKMFGFVTGEKSTFTLTPLGIRVIDPPQEKAARAESFLLVPLYKAVFDAYRGQLLPSANALEAAMERMGVAPKQKDKARQVFQRSATQAGYFTYGITRLVAPPIKSIGGDAATTTVPPVTPELGGGNGGGKEPPHKNPLIQGMLNKLPPDDSEWSMDLRKKWLQLAISVFENTYKTAADDTSELRITLTKNSAT